MTVPVVFDKLAFVRRLEAEGQFSRVQAEAMSEAFHQAVSETVATKADLAEVRHEIAVLGGRLDGRMESMAAEFRHSTNTLRFELKLWMGSIAAGLFAALSGMAALIRFLGH